MGFKNKKILAIIPAKEYSSELNNKNLLKINDKSLVQIATIACKKSRFIDHIVITSDSKKIINECLKSGSDSYVKRPKNISNKHSNILKAWQHCITKIISQTNIIFDYTILVEPTCPLRKPKTLDDAIKKIINNRSDYLITVSKVEKKFHPLKQFYIKKKSLIPYNKKSIKIVNRQELEFTYSKNGIAYISKTNKILKSKSLNFKKTDYLEVNYPIINIDSLEDFKLAKKYIELK